MKGHDSRCGIREIQALVMTGDNNGEIHIYHPSR